MQFHFLCSHLSGLQRVSCLSVHLSAIYGLTTRELRSAEYQNWCVNLPSSRSNRCANYQFGVQGSDRTYYGCMFLCKSQVNAQYISSGPTCFYVVIGIIIGIFMNCSTLLKRQLFYVCCVMCVFSGNRH